MLIGMEDEEYKEFKFRHMYSAAVLTIQAKDALEAQAWLSEVVTKPSHWWLDDCKEDL